MYYVTFMMMFMLAFQHINDMCFTIDHEEVLKTAEAIFLQLQSYPEVPNSIREIIGLEPVPETPSRSSPQRQTPPREASAVHASSVSSSANMPDRSRTLVNGSTSNSVRYNNGSIPHTQKEDSPSSVGTPDDNSIEILPDNMDVVF